MTVWVKENGTELHLNDNKETIKQALSYGWKRKEQELPDSGSIEHKPAQQANRKRGKRGKK